MIRHKSRKKISRAFFSTIIITWLVSAFLPYYFSNHYCLTAFKNLRHKEISSKVSILTRHQVRERILNVSDITTDFLTLTIKRFVTHMTTLSL